MLKKLSLGGVVVILASLVMASSAMAAVSTGYLEVCKHSDSTAPVSGPFQFTVDGHALTVLTGQCSAPMQVTAGNHTVVEASNAYTAETATDTIPQADLVSSDLTTRTDVVKVVAGDISTATTVEYTNKEVFGTLEICKSAQQGSGLTGTFSFEVKGPMGFDKTVTGVPVGACSDSFRVPAGTDEVDEIGSNNTDLVAVSTLPSADLVTDNLAAGTSEVKVAAGNDVNNETIETFVNSTSRLKICKVAGDSVLNGTVYSFTAAGQTVTAVAEPYPGSCVLVPTPFPGGTRVDIQEGIVPGTAVTDIAVSNNRAVPGSVDLANRKVSVILGSGETDVTYTNRVASPGLLKVCKNAGPGVTVGQVFKFTVGSENLSVPAGFCTLAGPFPFNSTQTITEAPTTGLSVIGEAVDPSADEVSESLSTGVVKALIGAGVTEVTYTNATAGTPPLPPQTGGGTGSGTGGSNAPTTVPVTTPSLPGVTPTPVVSTGNTPHQHECVVVARLVFVRSSSGAPSAGLDSVTGRPELILKLKGDKAVCNVLISEFSGQDRMIGHLRRHLVRGHVTRIMLAPKVEHVHVRLVK